MPALLNRLRRTAPSPIADARVRETRRLEADGSAAALRLVDVLQTREIPTVIEAARPALEQDRTPLPYKSAQTVGAMAKRASVQPDKAALLFSAVKAWQPAKVLEMGTCCGVSGAYLLAALDGGRLLSLEMSPILADAASSFWSGLGLAGEVRVGDFAETFEAALNPAPNVAFVDGNHQEEPTLHYFDRLADVCESGSLLVFDDLAWSDGMQSAWSMIKADGRVAAFADLETIGMVVLR